MKCEARKVNGARCGADAMAGQRRCFMHSRATAKAAKEARRRGGEARMQALRVTAIVPAGREAQIERKAAQGARVELPRWWDLRTREDVVAAVRDVGRAVVARTLDPRSANAALQAWQLLLAEKERQRTEKWARRRHARGELRDWLAQLREDVRGVRSTGDLDRVMNTIDHLDELAARVRGQA